jgi:hypothetical protein
MSANPMPIEFETLSCQLCLKELPVSEVKSAEATDYVVYFCGLDCYQQCCGRLRNKATETAGPMRKDVLTQRLTPGAQPGAGVQEPRETAG